PCSPRHGDLLFLFPSSLAGPSAEMETSAPLALKACGAPNVVEDDIDQFLSRQDGKISQIRYRVIVGNRHIKVGRGLNC
ncbi:hypothetical protein PSZ83_24055, partial [Shigella sonnei]|nr:hypothetical protein [Shigella sonnei]